MTETDRVFRGTVRMLVIQSNHKIYGLLYKMTAVNNSDYMELFVYIILLCILAWFNTLEALECSFLNYFFFPRNNKWIILFMIAQVSARWFSWVQCKWKWFLNDHVLRVSKSKTKVDERWFNENFQWAFSVNHSTLKHIIRNMIWTFFHVFI